MLIKEFFSPDLKCKRKGHNIEVKDIVIEKDSPGYALVQYDAKIKICSRCGEHLSEPYDEKFIQGFSGATMPSSYWAEIRRKGYRIAS